MKNRELVQNTIDIFSVYVDDFRGVYNSKSSSLFLEYATQMRVLLLINLYILKFKTNDNFSEFLGNYVFKKLIERI
jgi:hypothetical protein